MFSTYEEKKSLQGWGGEYKLCISPYRQSLFPRLPTGQHTDIRRVVPKKGKFFLFLASPNPAYIYHDLYICIFINISSIYT